MRKPAIRSLSVAAVGLALLASSAAAQQNGVNHVSDGGFESGMVSLSLPATTRFPVFSGGWASRGRRSPEIQATGSFAGVRSLRLETRPEDPIALIQDLPLDGAAYGLRFAFFIESGSQTVRLLGDWDRGSPADGTPAFEARLSTAGIHLATPGGTWRVETEISPLEWHSLDVVADPRRGTQDVRIDGRPVVSLPGVPFVRRSTLVIGGGAADDGVFRYDAIVVTSLVDLELAAITDAVAAVDIPFREAVLRRLAAARAALDRGSPTLALPELGVARNMLGLGTSGSVTQSARQAISDLMALIEATGRLRPAR